MNRYFFHIEEAVDLILDSLRMMKLGEIFVPKMKEYNIGNLASKISKKHKIIGLRQGEKMEEVLISQAEKNIAEKKKNLWIIRPYGSKRNISI